MAAKEETKANNQCGKCKITEGLHDIKIANQDLGKLCESHFKEFQQKIIEHFKTWIKPAA